MDEIMLKPSKWTKKQLTGFVSPIKTLIQSWNFKPTMFQQNTLPLICSEYLNIISDFNSGYFLKDMFIIYIFQNVICYPVALEKEITDCLQGRAEHACKIFTI